MQNMNQIMGENLVFDPKTRIALLTLVNTSDKTIGFKTKIVHPDSYIFHRTSGKTKIIEPKSSRSFAVFAKESAKVGQDRIAIWTDENNSIIRKINTRWFKKSLYRQILDKFKTTKSPPQLLVIDISNQNDLEEMCSILEALENTAVNTLTVSPDPDI